MKFLTERDTEPIAELEARLASFYSQFTGYPAFQNPSQYPEAWSEILTLARQVSETTGAPCRVLEVGAGRSGFGDFIRQTDRAKIHLTSQDITETNAGFLRETADSVITKPVDHLDGQWDIIFHTYVYEHVCRPVSFLETLWDRLAAPGFLVIQSPRYDFPAYLPPSLNHLSLIAKATHVVRLAASDLLSNVRQQPRFTIFADPAVFHLPFQRDVDAVHRVRSADISRLFRGRAFIRSFRLAHGNWKDWLVKTFFTLRVVIEKPDPQRGANKSQ